MDKLFRAAGWFEEGLGRFGACVWFGEFRPQVVSRLLL